MVDLFQARREHLAVLGGRPIGAQRHLEAAAQGGERGAQLMGGIGGEAPELREGGFESREHLVQRLREMVQLIPRAVTGQALAEIFGADPARRAGDRVETGQRGAGGEGAAGGREREPERDEYEERLRSEEHTSELQSLRHLVCRLLLEKKNTDY